MDLDDPEIPGLGARHSFGTLSRFRPGAHASSALAYD